MIIMKTSILRVQALLAALFVVGASAFAQTPYVWLDDKGIKQFSDQPPPASVPKNRILKYSGRAMDSSQDTSGDADADSAKAAKQPESLADKELAFKKRQEESAAKAKKAETEAKNAAAKADNCKRAQDYKASLESGQRISQTDASGNRSFMTDDARAQQLNDVNQKLGECN
jgi:Domain of unknown function (DUF4124)